MSAQAIGDSLTTMQPTTAPYEKRWWALGVLALSLLVISLDNTILNVAVPSVRADLSATSGQLQWILDSYLLVFAGLLLAAGSIGDRFGRKRALAFGLGVFGIGSVASALATSPDMLIATRAVMGIGGAFIMPATLSLITAIFPPEERPKAIGAWAAVSGLGIVIGPVTGGALLEQFSWSSVFWVNVPIIVVALILGHRLIPESRDPEARRLDLPGAGLSIVALTSVVWAIIEASSRGWTDGLVLGAFALGFTVAVAFVAWELRTANPMLEMRLFRDPRFSAASAAIAIVFAAMMGTILVLTQFLQSVHGYSALEAGAAMLPVGVAMIIGAGSSAKLDAALGTKVVVSAGLCLVALGCFLFAMFDTDSAYLQMAASFAAFGGGMGMAMAPATEAVMGAVPQAMAGVGSAMNDTTRMVGGALGVAILGSVSASGYSSELGPAVDALPADAAATATDSIGGAVAVASQIGGTSGQALIEAAHNAFVSSMAGAGIVAAGMALLAAVVAARFLPAREEALHIGGNRPAVVPAGSSSP